MLKRIIIPIILILMMASSLSGQNDQDRQTIFPRGIAIDYGLGSYSVRDEYISKEKYSGALPYFTASWSRFQEKGGYCLGLEFRSSDEIKNFNINTQIIQFALYRDYLYCVGKFSLFSKHVYAFLGPTPEFYFYYNQPNISRNGLYLNLSFAALLSLGCNGQFIMPLRQDLQAEGSFRISLLSVGLRMVELVDRDVGTDQPPLKFLTPFSGLNSTVNLGLRYYLLRSFSLKLAYKVQILRITPWDELISASDNLTASVSYHF